MAKYSPEQKTEALKKIFEGTSISKISEEMKISPATLFKWKKEANGDKPSQPRKKKAVSAAKPATTKKAAPKSATSNKDAVEAAYALLKEDDKAERIKQLEAELTVVRDINAQLAAENDIFRKALKALKEN